MILNNLILCFVTNKYVKQCKLLVLLWVTNIVIEIEMKFKYYQYWTLGEYVI